MNRYTVFKKTGTHADVLAAVGAADVLRQLEPRIVEFEDRFEVQLPRHLERSDLDAVDPGFSWLLRSGSPPSNVPPERIVGGGGNAVESRMYSILGRMKAHGGPNRLISRFAKMKREAWEATVHQCFHGSPAFVFSSPLVQLFNPQSAKGYALLKPSGTTRSDKTKDRWAEPFVEWLRFRGYFESSAGWFTSRNLRLYCLIPSDIPYREFVAVAEEFRNLSLGGTAVKMDCRAVLGLARLLIERAETFRRPNRSVRGVWVTHYKDMGQAHTLMGMEQLALPDWAELQTLNEHDTVLRRLNDSHSDEFALLKQYRRTFQTRHSESAVEFLDFVAGYGALLFRQRAEGHWLLPQFTLRGVTSILRSNPDLASMVDNPGFLAVAAAVRSSTVSPQAARHNGKSDHREIRYGLFSTIRRAGLLGKPPLKAEISSFVSTFNREAVKRRAMGLASAHIRDAERDAFTALMDRLPSAAPAASLLCGLAACIRHDKPLAESESEQDLAISV